MLRDRVDVGDVLLKIVGLSLEYTSGRLCYYTLEYKIILGVFMHSIAYQKNNYYHIV